MRFIVFLLVVYACNAAPTEKCEPSKIPFTIADSEFCDRYYFCENGTSTEEQCPDGLLYEIAGGKCDMPHIVNCGKRTKVQEAVPTLNCPRQNGMFEVEGTCNQFYHCTDGRETLITCPEGVIFEPKVGACIHPDLSTRKNCSATQILDFECPNRHHRFRRLRFGDHDRLPYPNNCRMFIMCLMTGEPRLGGCSLGLVFNPTSGRCDLPKNVKGCEDFYGPEEEEEEEDESDEVPDFGSFIDDGAVVKKGKVKPEIVKPDSEAQAKEGRRRVKVKKVRVKEQKE